MIVLLSTTKERASKLTHEIARATAAAAMRLLSASEEGTSELANEVVRPAAAATTAAVLVVTHECIHREAPKSTRAVACGTIDTPCPVTSIWPL